MLQSASQPGMLRSTSLQCHLTPGMRVAELGDNLAQRYLRQKLWGMELLHNQGKQRHFKQ
eukprot:766792-Hanusia_phi.AAC.5